MEAVVAPRGAREGGDDHEPDHVRREEERRERGAGAMPECPRRMSMTSTIGVTASGITAR